MASAPSSETRPRLVLTPGPQQAPTGTTLNCKDWQAEAALRMFLNNLDGDVAERPEDLVVYGGTGKAARDWESAQKIVDTLQRLELDETMIVQSGKPVAVFRTHKWAPKVLIANSNLVGKWANWEHFRELEDRGLMMYGQMTAGSWIYIGTQGILQGTYETLAAIADRSFKGTLKNTLTVTGGVGGMGGAQPLAVVMNEGTCLIADVEQSRIDFRLRTRYLDECAPSIDDAIDRALEAKENGEAVSIGVCCNATELLQRLLERDVTPDILTDQTSAHDPLNGYVPDGMSFEKAVDLRAADPAAYQRESFRTMGRHVELMLEHQSHGAETFDYGNNLRAFAKEEAGVDNAFDFPGFVPAYIRPLFCEGQGPFRWAALSGDPEDIRKTDEAILRLFPEKKALARWIKMAQERVEFQGLPCRICWLGYGERHIAGLEFNRMVRDGELSAPVAVGRDHLDCGSVASPNRETEGMKDGTDAVADWPLLNGMLAVAGGASWVSMHHGGGVGIGYSQHSGQVVVCDGSAEMDERIRAVMTNDPGMGVVRHVDAGYQEAETCRQDRGVDIP
ncbi:MAG: urocanate hydratase [Planctomycetes bacterium]|nr:urocanate hydratase [Planctomycetota bacterium]MCP4769992.1 urocanate hydratase [Planctomycetota bacterium]MCP4859832.1 urocanate hydratase [Planctomycetota bacterium]